MYFRGEVLNLDSNELSRLNEAYSFTPKTSIAIDISSEEGSGHLALETCKSFMKKLQSSVVDDSYGNYYDENQINNMMVDDEGTWLKKS